MLLKIREEKNIIYSFDVFDTLITRAFATPDGVFLLMQEKLQNQNIFQNLPKSLKHNFYNIRHESQHFCIANQYMLNKKHDCNFDDIYEVIKNNYGLSDDEKELLKQLEIETELANILPIEENINKLKKYIKENKKVILISDMYFSQDVIRKFLVKIDSIFENIDIYTSGDLGKLKFDGTLYKYIKDKYPNTKFVHLGDNKFADFLVPKLYGIKSEKYSPEKLKPYEKILLKDEHSLYKNLSVGISRYLRRNNKSKTFQLGCSFAAPLLYGYVDWVLEQSIQRGIKHLYFVARDGYVLKQIADIIIEQKQIDIQTHYFYSSRIANRIPDESNYEEFVHNICNEYFSSHSYNYFAKRLNITIEELKNFITVSNEKKHMSAKEVKKFYEEIIKNQEFKNFLLEKNRHKKELFGEYIEQEINLAENNFAFVDLNGSGRTQDNIANIICKKTKQCIISFYLSSISLMNQKNNSIKIFYTYFGDLYVEYLELFCRTTHGQTVGYNKQDNKIMPILEYQHNELMEKWGYLDYLEGIKFYSKCFSTYLTINNIDIIYDEIFKEYFNYFRYEMNKNIINKIPYTRFGKECKTKKFVYSNSIFYNLLNYFATKQHKFTRKILIGILILLNCFNIDIKKKLLYEWYYEMFYK